MIGHPDKNFNLRATSQEMWMHVYSRVTQPRDMGVSIHDTSRNPTLPCKGNPIKRHERSYTQGLRGSKSSIRGNEI